MIKKRDQILEILYCIVLLAECIALYKVRPHYYQFTRLLTTLILFVYVYRGDNTKVFNLYIYVAIAFVALADILTLFTKNNWFYIGLSLFTFSYLSLSAIFYRKRKNISRKKIPPTLIVIAILLIILISLKCFIPEIAMIIIPLQSITHAIVIGILVVWSAKVKSTKMIKNGYLIPASLLILLANICYTADIFMFNMQYTIMRVLVVFLHGLYLLLLFTGIKRIRKR